MADILRSVLNEMGRSHRSIGIHGSGFRQQPDGTKALRATQGHDNQHRVFGRFCGGTTVTVERENTSNLRQLKDFGLQ